MRVRGRRVRGVLETLRCLHFVCYFVRSLNKYFWDPCWVRDTVIGVGATNRKGPRTWPLGALRPLWRADTTGRTAAQQHHARAGEVPGAGEQLCGLSRLLLPLVHPTPTPLRTRRLRPHGNQWAKAGRRQALRVRREPLRPRGREVQVAGARQPAAGSLGRAGWG